MIRVARLNHAVLFVRDLETAVDFYHRIFGFNELPRERANAAFMRAEGSSNHHDLGLFAVGPDAPRPPRGATGLYHLAWEVPAIEDLVTALKALSDEGALTGMSDHGATKSAYGRDPDGNEFEIMWPVPRDQWGPYEQKAITQELDLARELARFGAEAPKA